MPSPHQFPPRPSPRDIARGAAAFRAGYPCIPPTSGTHRGDWIKGWKEEETASKEIVRKALQAQRRFTALPLYGPPVENAVQTAIVRELSQNPVDDFGNPIAEGDRP